MAITLDGTTGITAAGFDGTIDASNLTGDIDASQLTGTLPAIDGSALTGIDTSPPTTAGGVGTYALMQNIASPSGGLGTTKPGSDLRFTPVYWVNEGSPSGSGTWQVMGRFDGSGVNNAYAVTVCLRIA